MSKRKSRRYSGSKIPARMYAESMKSYSAPNAEKMAEYHNRTRSVQGPKNNAEPIVGNTFGRIIRDGQVWVIQCDCGAGPFKFQSDYLAHIKQAQSRVDYNPQHHFRLEEPESRQTLHTYEQGRDGNTGDITTIKMPTPLKIVKEQRYSLWQSDRRQGFNELNFFQLDKIIEFEKPRDPSSAVEIKWLAYYVSNKSKWWIVREKRKVNEEQPFEVKRSVDFPSKARVELAFRTGTILWDSDREPYLP